MLIWYSIVASATFWFVNPLRSKACGPGTPQISHFCWKFATRVRTRSHVIPVGINFDRMGQLDGLLVALWQSTSKF